MNPAPSNRHQWKTWSVRFTENNEPLRRVAMLKARNREEAERKTQKLLLGRSGLWFVDLIES